MGDINKKLFEKEYRGRWMDGNRRSGRTFRKLLAAIKYASDGLEVAIYFNSDSQARGYALSMAKTICSAVDGVKIGLATIHFPWTGGHVYFIERDTSRWREGRKLDHEFEDLD